MILGYAEQPSPRAGDDVVLRVSTDAPQFRVELYRWGASLERVGGTGWLDGVDAPPHLPHQDWGEQAVDLDGRPLDPWPAYPVPLPPSTRPGVHLAVLVEGEGQGGVDRTAPEPGDGRDARALFVVRAREPRAPLLYKLPLLTWHAYDVVAPELYRLPGGRFSWCFYDWPDLPVEVPRGLSVHRPGGGVGGRPFDVDRNPDPYDPTPRQAFAHWDAPFLAWLETEGYDVDYCTDVDLHREGADLLAPHRLLVSVGHDEYWSDAMRDAVEGWVAAGGNAAFFSGNTCWWRVVFAGPTTFDRVVTWSEAGRPENALLGVSFRNGGERDRDEHPATIGFQVQHAEHWVFAGTGLRDGDLLGAEENVIGYECDGAAFDRAAWEAGAPAVPTGEDGTPADFVVLGVGDCRSAGYGFGNGAATMGLHEPGGTVFTGSTTDWARAMRTSAPLQQVTRNVLDRLGGR